MAVVVTDSSIFMDLEQGRLTEHCFALPVSFRMPDLLFMSELASPEGEAALGEKLLRLGLDVVELNANEVQRAVHISRRFQQLPLTESFALSLAEARNWTLLTGDDALRTACENLKVFFREALWVLDLILRKTVWKPGEPVSSLKDIRSHPDCRLPLQEIDSRIRHYSIEG